MATYTVEFIADGSGDIVSFKSDSVTASLTVDNVSLKKIDTVETVDNASVKEFLSGTTDEGNPIFFRVDTQSIQLNTSFETFSNPIAIATRSHRGTLMKCFVALDDEDFYEIQGTVTKGVSILKVHSKDRKAIPTPPIAREIMVSWRDSSKQLCRLVQTSIIFIPGTMDYSE